MEESNKSDHQFKTPVCSHIPVTWQYELTRCLLLEAVLRLHFQKPDVPSNLLACNGGRPKEIRIVGWCFVGRVANLLALIQNLLPSRIS
jgi:hypothetical protein